MQNFTRSLWLISICLLSMSLIACKQATISTDVDIQTLSYKKTNNTIDLNISCDYPIQANSAVGNAIAEYIEEQMGGTYTHGLVNGDSLINYYGQQLEKDLIENAQELIDAGATPQIMYQHLSFTKEVETPTYITYLFTSESFLGGAHGMHTSQGVTFRKSDGRRFGHELIRQYVDTKDINSLLKEGLMRFFSDQNQPISHDEDLKNMLLIDDINNIPLPSTPPYLTEKGVVFTYQPYEIACYATGIISFVVPYYKISDYLIPSIKSLLPKGQGK